jgi:lipopolysaccharide transport system ATP-binding protein
LDQNVTLRPGRGTFRCALRDLPLANGGYTISIYMATRAETEMLDSVQDAAFVNVSGGDYFGTGHPGIPRDCKVLTRANWSWE